MNYYHSPLYIKLSEYLFCCRKASVYVNIALVMLKKIREFPTIYIEEIALLANTTPASVTRFCKVLGTDISDTQTRPETLFHSTHGPAD